MRKSFEEYDKESPQVWEAFVYFAIKTMGKGFKHYSARGIFELIRWPTGVKGVGTFKVDNTFSKQYAEKFERTYPHHAGFFRTRNKKEKNENN